MSMSDIESLESETFVMDWSSFEGFFLGFELTYPLIEIDQETVTP